MISIIITAYKEPKTIGRAIEKFIPQLTKKDEIIVMCPDRETATAAKKYKVKVYDDDGKQNFNSKKGKPHALNNAFKISKGNVLVLTDGDVFVSDNAIKEIIKPFKDNKVGAVSGRPISLNPRTDMLGYFSHLLTDEGAHQTRLNLDKKNKYLICSGYLMAIRKGIIKEIPENSLADDAVISNLIYSKGYKIKYAPESKVFVKFPTTLKDWIKQKRRSAGGYVQMKKIIKTNDEMRSFLKESKEVFRALNYYKTIKEMLWTLALIVLRLYLWLDIFINIKLRKQDFAKIWKPIKSTK
ncbi:glycosyltransferase family 2 protein [Candidatus Woesearchaeota archaeon]|nr:glycosyltransferase family 2 protein [Candidatus Woesearchaeota archaeon]